MDYDRDTDQFTRIMSRRPAALAVLVIVPVIIAVGLVSWLAYEFLAMLRS